MGAGGHDLHGSNQGRRLPVPFGAEAVSLGHQTLNRQTRQLDQATQVFKGRGERLEATVGKEPPGAHFDSSRLA